MPLEEINDQLVHKISTFATKQLRLEERIELLEEQVKAAKKQLTQISEIDIPEVMEEAGVRSIQLSDGSEVKVKEILLANIKKADEPEAYTWLVKHDLGSIIKSSFILEYGKGESKKANEAKAVLEEHSLDFKSKETVHVQTLRKTMRELLEDGDVKVPMQLFGIHEVRKTEIERRK